MTRTHRIIAFSLIAALLLAGFVIGRFSKSAETVNAEATPLAANTADSQPAPQPVSAAATDKESNFYLSDFKVGYNEGYKAGKTGQDGAFPETARAGYNDGYKQGYGDALKNQAQETTAEPTETTAPATTRPRAYYRSSGRTVVYRTVAHHHHSNAFRNALTIGAPAAIGAGIGALFGGKKGAGIGALFGGGGGAFYLLKKHRY